MKRFDDVLVVTDLDGTLYENQNDIPAVNIDAINRFIEGLCSICFTNLCSLQFFCFPCAGSG